jgi:predicted Zn-dependent protease
LLRGLPRRDFAYRFAIVDEMEPNAFALPGGYIFVSRGLLALTNNEDELACILGHEIVHAANRHSAQQQEVARNQSPLALGMKRARTLAAYGRDMERAADVMGQRLAAAAGYDPMGMSTFMRRLDQREKLLTGVARVPTFFDSHPGSGERSVANAMRAGELRWTRDPALGDTRVRLLNEIDGMAIGDRPETGVFVDELFLHPMLGFEIRFPKGWQPQNNNRTVGATAPRGEAVIYMTSGMPPGDLVELADGFASQAERDFGVKVTEKKNVRLGDREAVRYGFSGGRGGRPIEGHVTFFPFTDGTWRIVGVTSAVNANRYSGQILLTTRSFGPLTDEHRVGIKTNRLRIVAARTGENFVALSERTENAWPPLVTALINGKLGDEVLEAGELVKTLQSERFEKP